MNFDTSPVFKHSFDHVDINVNVILPYLNFFLHFYFQSNKIFRHRRRERGETETENPKPAKTSEGKKAETAESKDRSYNCQ